VLNFERKIVIDGDAKDYYSYLVSIFITHNFTHQIGNDWYLIQTPTGTINVHTIGVSILVAPFFFGAFLYSKFFNFPLDGFSSPFQISVYLAGIFYCVIGLIFLKKLLLQLNFKQHVVASLIVLTAFGTHLFSYTVNESGMPHVYAFALTSMFFYFILNLFQKRETKYFYLCALVLGLIILVRPVNIIILSFVPFFFQNKYDLISNLKEFVKSKHFYLSIIVLFLVCSIQSVAWYSQNGKLLQDSYVGNGFYFNNPQIFKMLFGFNNGLFIYVPLCFLMLFGLIPMFASNRYKGFVFILSIGFILYIFASYWAYNYFDGYGIRTLVDFLPIFVIAGAYLFQMVRSKLNYLFIALASLFLFINIFHIYQYKNGIIKANGMNFEKYAYIFLKSNKLYADSLGGANDLPLYSKEGGKLVFESRYLPCNQQSERDSVCNFKDLEYLLCFDYTIKKPVNNFFIVAEFERKEMKKNSSFNTQLTLGGNNSKNENKMYQAYKINEVPAINCCDWKKCTFSIAVTTKFDKDDKLNMFIWNADKTQFLIKNFKVKIFDYSYTI